jgi:hypothetical protein
MRSISIVRALLLGAKTAKVFLIQNGTLTYTEKKKVTR